MIKVYKRIYTQFLFISFAALLSSCVKDQISMEEMKPVPVNSFAMEVNGKAWQPGQIGEDECMRTYNGAWSKTGNIPYFNIIAYWDPKGLTDVNSENVLNMQIFDVNQLGEYKLKGSYLESKASYVFFKVHKLDGSFTRYTNKRESSSFTVEFKEFIAVTYGSLKGVSGVFYGTLYNESNPLDSITITRGAFTLKKTNFYNFDQCD